MEKIVKDFLLDLAEKATDMGVRIALVGGAVRDLLLEKKGVDIDIVVESDAIDFVQKLFPNCKKRIYKYFHTASVWVSSVGRVDFATAREEYYSCCAAKPKIRFSTIEKDLFRRDFTINSMAILLKRNQTLLLENLIDLYSGREHLRKGILDVLHDNSFCDDPVRLLRGFRYAVRFNFNFSTRTNLLIDKAKENSYLKLVPVQRLRDEYILINREPDPKKVFELVKERLGLDLTELF